MSPVIRPSHHALGACVLLLAVATAGAASPSTDTPPPPRTPDSNAERGLTGTLMRLDFRIHRIRSRIRELKELEKRLPTPIVEPSRATNQNAALLKLVQADSPTAPWIEFRFPQPLAVDELYLVPAPLLLNYQDHELRGSPMGSPKHFHVKVETGSDTFTIATRYREPPGRNMPLRLTIDHGDVRSLRIHFPHLLKSPYPAYVALSEIFILSGGRNVAPRAAVQWSPSLEPEPGWETHYATDERHWLGLPFASASPSRNGFLSGPAREGDTPWVEFQWDTPITLDEVRLFPAQFLFHPGKSTYLFPDQLRIEAWADPADSAPAWSWDYETARDGELGPNVITARLEEGASPPVSRLRITSLACKELDGFRGFALGEVQVWARQKNLAATGSLQVSSRFDDPLWSPEGLTDNRLCLGRILPLPEWLAGLDERFKIIAERRYLERLLERYTISWRIATAWLWFTLALLTFLGLGGQWFWSRWKRFQADVALRNQMMMDLHDELGGNMGTIALIAEQLRPSRDADDDPEWRERKCATILDIVSTTRQILPRIVWSTKSDRQPLPDEIEALLQALPGETAEIHWDASGYRKDFRLPAKVEEALYLIAKEAIQNCAKHANATRVEGSLSEGENGILLVIRDNGAWKGPADAAGVGMRSMRTRARQVGAELTIEPSADGTTIQCLLPRSAFLGD